MNLIEEQQYINEGYKVSCRCTDGSPVLQKEYEPGITHVIWGAVKNDYWAVNKDGKVYQFGTHVEAILKKRELG